MNPYAHNLNADHFILDNQLGHSPLGKTIFSSPNTFFKPILLAVHELKGAPSTVDLH